MGGVNPYIEKADIELPQKVYKITLRVEGKSIEVEMDPTKIPYSETGLPGSLLSTALGSGIDLEHACGGVCADAAFLSASAALEDFAGCVLLHAAM